MNILKAFFSPFYPRNESMNNDSNNDDYDDDNRLDIIIKHRGKYMYTNSYKCSRR